MRAKLLFWLKKDGHKNEIFHQPGQTRWHTPDEWPIPPNLWGRSRFWFWFRFSRRPYWDERKVSRFTSVRLSSFICLCCRFQTWDKLEEWMRYCWPGERDIPNCTSRAGVSGLALSDPDELRAIAYASLTRAELLYIFQFTYERSGWKGLFDRSVESPKKELEEGLRPLHLRKLATRPKRCRLRTQRDFER